MDQFALAVSREVVGKANSPEQHALLSKELEPARMTMYDLHDHLAVKGFAICCANLKVEPGKKTCRRREESFLSAQIIGVDIDHGKISLKELAEDPFLIENAAFAYTTPSHTPEHPRIRIMFVLESPITNLPAYKARVSIIADRWDGDQNARDGTRIWYGNENAETIWFRKTLSAAVIDEMLHEAEQSAAVETQYKAFKDRDIDLVDLRAMLKHIPSQQDHMDWKRTYSGVFNHFGCTDEVCTILEQWSPAGQIPYPKRYQKRLIRVNIGTVIYIARKHGYEPPKGLFKPEPKTSGEAYDAAEQWLRNAAEFRYNTVNLCIQYRDHDGIWETVGDYTVNSWLRKMRASGIKIPSTKIWEIVNSDFAPEFNPLRDYFDGLQPWDGETDYIAEVVSCLPIDKELSRLHSDGKSLHYTILTKWFVGGFACSYHHEPNHIMPILQGGQGIGKTRFIRALCPKALRRNNYYEGSISIEKDDRLMLASSFIAVDDELESMTKREAEAMKSIVTKASDRVRPVYQRTAIVLARVVNFIGSVNRRNFLNDETGSRRFPAVPISGTIDMEKMESIDIDKVWAQAKAMYEAGYVSYLNAQETEAVNTHNAAFQQRNMTDDLVEQYVKPIDSTDGKPWNATQVAMAIAKTNAENHGPPIHVDGRFTMALGKSLVKAGYHLKSKRIEDKVYHGYYVYVSAGSVYTPSKEDGNASAGF